MERPGNLPLFSDDECSEIRTRVHGLRDRWMKRDIRTPAFSLGVSTHYDGYDDYSVYASNYRASNRSMWASFGDILERVRAGLAAHLDEEVVFDSDALALPGFHIFGAHRLYAIQEDPAHYDLHYLWHDWSRYKAVDPTRATAITVPIHLPASGGGMKLWDQHHSDPAAPRNNGELSFSDRQKFTFHRYTPGIAAVHSGHTMHAMAPYEGHDPEDERMTLQGHTNFCDGKHVLYW